MLLAFTLAACSLALNPTNLPVSAIALTNRAASLNLGQLGFDTRMGQILVPAGQLGQMLLIDPDTLEVATISGFSTQSDNDLPPGPSAAAVGGGYLFVVDRAAVQLYVVDPAQRSVISSVRLAGPPDSVAYVAASNEVWVTEPAQEQIEIFTLEEREVITPVHAVSVSIPKGPVGLVVDRGRGLAFTNRPGAGATAVLQVMTHSVIDEWGNGCSQARGMALDEKRGYLFVACGEGKLVMMDATRGGQQLASQTFGGDLDAVGYNPALQHVYLPSSASAILAIFGVTQASGGQPALKRLGTADTTVHAHCVTADEHENVWVCDPDSSRLLWIRDTFPAGGG